MARKWPTGQTQAPCPFCEKPLAFSCTACPHCGGLFWGRGTDRVSLGTSIHYNDFEPETQKRWLSKADLIWVIIGGGGMILVFSKPLNTFCTEVAEGFHWFVFQTLTHSDANLEALAAFSWSISHYQNVQDQTEQPTL